MEDWTGGQENNRTGKVGAMIKNELLCVIRLGGTKTESQFLDLTTRNLEANMIIAKE